MTGGWMNSAFNYVQESGICSEEEYPYTGVDGLCSADSCASVAQLVGYHDLPVDDAAFEQMLLTQPISVAMEASMDMQLYVSGVMNGVCGTEINHGLLAVGFGTDPVSGLQYWRMKNSWSSAWGDQGYIKLVRDISLNEGAGQCGMYLYASVPTLT
jgi:C1A family cysteine protease